MPNAWIQHVKKFAADKNISYSCALSMPECKVSYKSKEEPKKESKPKESEIKETKVYTMYKAPIGPKKPVPPVPKKALDKTTTGTLYQTNAPKFNEGNARLQRTKNTQNT
jgi:hypothetical protein